MSLAGNLKQRNIQKKKTSDFSLLFTLIQHLKSSTYEEEKLTINPQEHHGEKTAGCLSVPVKALTATSDDPSLITESHTGEEES